VDDPSQADVTLEVENAERADQGRERTVPNPVHPLLGTTTTKQRDPTIYATLRAGEYSLRFESTRHKYSLAASGLAKAVEQWVKDNRPLLATRRGGVW
jgi:hypothetical protein